MIKRIERALPISRPELVVALKALSHQAAVVIGKTVLLQNTSNPKIKIAILDDGAHFAKIFIE